MKTAMNTTTKLAFLILVGALAGTGAQAGGDPEEGKKKSQACAACHGPAGISTAPIYPHLAGQHASYIVRALKDYQSGARQNPIMQPMAAPLSEQDMEDIAAYYAEQDGLVTPMPK
jgi:cytochrome c553